MAAAGKGAQLDRWVELTRADAVPSPETATDPAQQGGSFLDFTAAAAATLGLLRQRLGFRLWLVTRKTGAQCAVLLTDGGAFGPAVGSRHGWSDTLCSRMLAGLPRVAPDLSQVPAYAAAPFAQRYPVAAYLGVPLLGADGELLGTLCALDPRPQPPQVAAELPLVELQARLLATLLAAELHTDRQRRRAERAEVEALVDPLTGLANRRAWQTLLDREEERCRRYGDTASILVLDLDNLKAVNDEQGHPAGDRLLADTAGLPQQTSRGADVVARLGGDEFAVLAVRADSAAAQQEGQRLERHLAPPGSAPLSGSPPEARPGSSRPGPPPTGPCTPRNAGDNSSATQHTPSQRPQARTTWPSLRVRVSPFGPGGCGDRVASCALAQVALPSNRLQECNNSL